MNNPDVTEQSQNANAGCVQRVVLLQLAKDWAFEANECHETARQYDKAGNVFAALQRHEYGDALEACVKDIERAMQQNADLRRSAGKAASQTKGTFDEK